MGGGERLFHKAIRMSTFHSLWIGYLSEAGAPSMTLCLCLTSLSPIPEVCKYGMIQRMPVGPRAALVKGNNVGI